ncbi:MAG: chorismate-binding protein [Rhodospirillum sp.]|nr:chorismate-binding protein [Rhodospirillum sp.]MCF8489734.1 chorismate-binding protein [Rhodospirillum sp.]MCF8502778.1 chorismate-binding protein [Rhodospirillum sp.]
MNSSEIELVDGVAADAVARLTGCNPHFVFERFDPRTRRPVQTHIGFNGTGDEFHQTPADGVFSALRQRIANDASIHSDAPPGAGGGVLALIGYSLLAGRPPLPRSADAAPEAVILTPGLLVTIDHGAGRAWLAAEVDGASEVEVQTIRDALKGLGEVPAGKALPAPAPEWSATTSEADFAAFARSAQARMGPGQPVEGVVLSVQMRSRRRCDPLAAYRVLRAINPSSYMFLARSPSLDAWGATSLGLVRLTNGRFFAETDGATRPYEDESFVWMPSPKEIAEYDVVVGALREALEPLTDEDGLTFDSEMEERRFFNLAHLFATATGRLAPGIDRLDLVRALSPHGAAVGHHRQPALDLIATSETVVRGPFSGTIGFFGYDGSIDASAFTRSMWQTETGMTVHAGAKVVPASIPEEEYRECVLKTLALRRCVEPS